MSHLHFPDGILPIWLWVSTYVVLAVLMALSLWYVSRKDIGRKIPLIGVLSAMMIVGMSFEIVALAYHINLAIPTALIVGPAGILISAFVTNFFLGLFGHGGMTVVGLNTLMLALEGILGFLLFYYIVRISSLFWRGAIATFVALAVSGMLAIGLTVWVVPQEIGRQEDGGGVVRFELFTAHEEGESRDTNDVLGVPTQAQEQKDVDIKRFVTVALALGVVGWVLEALLSGFIIAHISRVKPDLISLSRK
ncbi:MAG: energy-coupling factor ABC transporter permease [bacterium]|nr:energy-coupling factor ABC transporter permease [bacterium]